MNKFVCLIKQNIGTDKKSFIMGDSMEEVLTMGFMEVVR
jgi:hypothetical protein